MLARLCLLVCVSYVAGQRPSFAGTRPIGYPELYDRPTTEGLGNRFGESDGTTQRLPVEAKGDRELVERLSKLPIDQQPFWLINWKALEEHRQNPQTYPQKPNIFIDNIPSSVTTSNINTNTNPNNFNTPPNNNNTPPNNFNTAPNNLNSFNTAQNVNIPSNNPNTSPSILNTAQNINRPLNTLNTPPNNFNTAQNVNIPSNNPNTSPSNFNTSQSNQQNTNTNRPNLLNRNSGPIKVDNDKKPTTAIKDKVKPLSVIPVKDESKPEIHISTDEDEDSFEDYSSFEIDKDSYKHGGKNVKQ